MRTFSLGSRTSSRSTLCWLAVTFSSSCAAQLFPALNWITLIFFYLSSAAAPAPLRSFSTSPSRFGAPFRRSFYLELVLMFFLIWVYSSCTSLITSRRHRSNLDHVSAFFYSSLFLPFPITSTLSRLEEQTAAILAPIALHALGRDRGLPLDSLPLFSDPSTNPPRMLFLLLSKSMTAVSLLSPLVMILFAFGLFLSELPLKGFLSPPL